MFKKTTGNRGAVGLGFEILDEPSTLLATEKVGAPPPPHFPLGVKQTFAIVKPQCRVRSRRSYPRRQAGKGRGAFLSIGVRTLCEEVEALEEPGPRGPESEVSPVEVQAVIGS